MKIKLKPIKMIVKDGESCVDEAEVKMCQMCGGISEIYEGEGLVC